MHEKAKDLLTTNRDKMELMVDALMKYETIDADQIDDIMQGNPARAPKDWADKDDLEPTPA